MMQIITPTGDRPLAWKLCQRYVERQTYEGPVEWHVVDDGIVPIEVNFSRKGYTLHVHRLEPMAGNSQARNLLYLIDQIDKRYPVVCFEDDDRYAADWLSICATHLERASLVGETRARYYNVAAQVGRQLNNTGHASLCATAMTGDHIERFRHICRTKVKYIDIDLWRGSRDSLLFTGHRVVGIKGMPGRGGIGMGHEKRFSGQRDPSGALLREWIGADADWYLPASKN